MTAETSPKTRSSARLFSDYGEDLAMDGGAVQQRRRHNSVNGKEIIIRPVIRSSHGSSYSDAPSRASTLARRSLRRRIKEPKPKYYKLESTVDGGGSDTLKSASKLHSANKTHKKSAGVFSMGDIFSSVKRGMSTLTMPKFQNKSKQTTSNKNARAETTLGIGGETKESMSPTRVKGKRPLRNGFVLSASSTDVRSVSSGHHRGSSPCDTDSHAGSECLKANKALGITGLRNHGNTCYMNAILQCLCHTDNLAKYFVLDGYKTDLTRRNKTNSKKYGTKGEVTEQLALVFKSLWSSQYSPEISNQFKNVVGKYETQYRGSNQQDAQEFLLWLLDKVHEDLNTATKKKYKKIGSNMGRPDEVVAAEALANHMRCNNSFVHDLFQAQYRSSLTCPSCEKQSITFDPFLCISTPIPQRQFRPVFVTVVYLSQQPKQVKLGLRVHTQANIRELREIIAADAGIPESQIILTELHQDNFGRTFRDSDHINTIQESDSIYAIEVPVTPQQTDGREGEFILLLWVNKLGVGTPAKRFGGPYATQIHREVNYTELQKAVLKGMSNVLKDGVIDKEMDSIIRFRVIDGIPGKCYLPDDVEHPLYMQTVDQALSSQCGDGRGPGHLKITVEWDLEIREIYFQTTEELIAEHTTVAEMQSQQNQVVSATLIDCFNLYTQEEKLGPEDPWLCPSCKRPQQGVKKLSLWSVPDVLVIHLKRFRQTNTQRTKLETFVDFPTHGLDMSQHIVLRSDLGYLNHHGNGVLGYWSPWKQPTRHLNRADSNVYDLYGICNHHGSMQSGHYTAYCKNPVDGLWYHFDDTTVKKVEESEIVTPSAYILYYQRRSTNGYSSSESSSCGCPDHWAYHMPKFRHLAPKVSKSHDNLCDLDYRNGSNTLSKDRHFLRGARKYASMVPLGYHKRNAHKDISNSAENGITHNNQTDDEENKDPHGFHIPESSV